MKMTNFTMISLVNFLNDYTGKRLPQKINYAISRNMSKLQEEYKFYETSLNGIMNTYREHFVMNEESGQPEVDNNGLPKVDDSVSEDYYNEISALLSIEVDVNLYFVDESVFDYDETKGNYDVIPAKDILALQSILCEQEKEEKSE